ncbi:hypothetical protein DXG01_005456 [Tephrocybe rancida]|nr:hypothetical protein DXG01_005456 [Tephrocybe rancida]
MPEKGVDDVSRSPTDPAYTSSEQGLRSPTDSVSSTKEDLEVASRPLPAAVVNTPTFPEGGLQAWLTDHGDLLASGFGMGVRAVAFMDLGLLILANLIMRARLPPKRRGNEGGSVLKEVITDVPYLLFVLGSFLVRDTLPDSQIVQFSLWCVSQVFLGVFVPCKHLD